jgi:uncharacterized protein YjlB
MNAKAYYFNDDGIIPNNALPVILYPKAFDLADCSDWLENFTKTEAQPRTTKSNIKYFNLHEVKRKVLIRFPTSKANSWHILGTKRKYQI